MVLEHMDGTQAALIEPPFPCEVVGVLLILRFRVSTGNAAACLLEHMGEFVSDYPLRGLPGKAGKSLLPKLHFHSGSRDLSVR